MTKKEVLKAGAKLVVSFGVGTIVTNAVAFTTPVVAMGVLKRVAIGIGSFTLSAFTSEKIADYADEKIDEAFDEFSKMSDETEVEIRKEART